MSSIKLQTEISFADRLYQDWQKLLKNDPNGKVYNVALHLSSDPITHRNEVAVFTNDGSGNGELLFKFDLN